MTFQPRRHPKGSGPYCQSPGPIVPGLRTSPIPAIVVPPKLFLSDGLHQRSSKLVELTIDSGFQTLHVEPPTKCWLLSDDAGEEQLRLFVQRK